MKKYCIILIAVVLTLSLWSCAQKQSNDTAESTVPEKIVLFDESDGRTCRVVYPDNADENIKMLATEQIGARLRELTGKNITVSTESELPNDGMPSIYLGNTSAAWRAGIAEDSGYYNYTLTVREEGIYAYSINNEVLPEAVVKLCLKLSEWYSNGKLVADVNFSLTSTLAKYKLLGNIPYFSDGTYHSTHDCDNGHQMVLIRNASAEGFDRYCEKIEGNGYVLAAENNMNSNLFRTYFNDEGIMLHTYYTEHNDEVRVIAADNPDRQSETGGNGNKYESFLLPLDADAGMGYVFRLGDGSFIIIDGGHANSECRDDIFDAIYDNAPDKKNIVISAWIFTHGHTDHVGAFIEFAKEYHSNTNIKIKSFMHNMCLTEEQSKYFATGTWTNCLDAMEQYYPEVPVYIALTGQKYTFADATVEIFFTMPDYMPKKIENGADAVSDSELKGDGNIQSMVFRLTLDGRSVFIMGDTTKECCDEMSTRYGDYLKSDYAQMAHHGINDERPRAQNATKEIYNYIRPEYALLPCASGQTSSKLSNEVSKYLLELIGGKDKVIVSGSYKKIIPFGGT